MIYLRPLFVFLAFVLFSPFAISDTVITCGTSSEDMSMSLIAQRPTDQCVQLDKNEVDNQYRQLAMAGGLSPICNQDLAKAIQCCAHPDSGQCGEAMPFRPPQLLGGVSDQLSTLIRTNLIEQNKAAVRAYSCEQARKRCSDSCIADAGGQGAILCEKFVAFEHCEKQVANTFLGTACSSIRTLSRTLAAESPPVTVLCTGTSDFLMCNSN